MVPERMDAGHVNVHHRDSNSGYGYGYGCRIGRDSAARDASERTGRTEGDSHGSGSG